MILLTHVKAADTRDVRSGLGGLGKKKQGAAAIRRAFPSRTTQPTPVGAASVERQ